jgi:hypothetical protein
LEADEVLSGQSKGVQVEITFNACTPFFINYDMSAIKQRRGLKYLTSCNKFRAHPESDISG